ncbi:MAG: hypothetical protein JSR82_04375 [Verrucomicrobia bacterium]|nr:hypothetical protein [Verrucomicrobiota bacterium]
MPLLLPLRRSYWVRQAFMLGLCTLLALPLVYMGWKRGVAFMALFGLCPLGFWLGFSLLEFRRGVAVLDAEGLTRRDGRRFLWRDLREIRRVHMRFQSGQTGPLNHLELHFPNGQARIFPLVIEHAAEALAFVDRLPKPPAG